MRIRTKIAINYVLPPASTANGIVEGVLENASWMNGFNTVGANYVYMVPVGEEGQYQILVKKAFTATGEEIEALYQAVNDQVPAGLTYAETQEYLFNLAFMIEMQKTFVGLNPDFSLDDIEIVND